MTKNIGLLVNFAYQKPDVAARSSMSIQFRFAEIIWVDRSNNAMLSHRTQVRPASYRFCYISLTIESYRSIRPDEFRLCNRPQADWQLYTLGPSAVQYSSPLATWDRSAVCTSTVVPGISHPIVVHAPRVGAVPMRLQCCGTRPDHRHLGSKR